MSQAEQMSRPEFPIEKNDIRWGEKEVTMNRQKFEALLHYLEDVSERLVQAEDELSFQKHDTRKAEKAADVFLALSASLSETRDVIQKWLADPENSIQELSRRTGIPYATCHRIVTERLEDARIETGQLQKLAKAVAGPMRLQAAAPRSSTEWRMREVFAPILGAKLTRTFLPESSRIFGVNAKGDLLRKVREVQPNVVLVDVSSSKLSGETLKSLGEFAMKSGITLVFTGAGRKKKKSEAVEKVLAVGDVADTKERERI